MSQPSSGPAGGGGASGGQTPGVPPGNRPEEVRGLYHQAVTGKAVPRDDKISVSRLRSMVSRYGSITAAAREAGVARTTFSGWINADKNRRSRPSTANKAKVVDLQARIRRDDAVKAVQGRRGSRMRKTGATLSVDGVGGPVCSSPDDAQRGRGIDLFLSGTEADHLAQLMAAEDPAAMTYLNDLYAAKYMQGGQWEWSQFNDIRFHGF